MRSHLSLVAVSMALGGTIVCGSAIAQERTTLVVGAIYVGSVNDFGYNRAMKDGLEEMRKNVPGLKLIEAENVPETAESERVMENMVQQGAQLIFATSFGHQNFAFNVAKRHPEVYVQHAGGWMVAPNFGNFFGATQAAWFPMGVAAGRMTRSNTLGFVAGVPLGYVVGNINAFHLGARSVNPEVVTRVVVTGGWADKAKEVTATNALIDQGADIVTMHVDSPATIIQMAERRDVRSIGYPTIEARQVARNGWIAGLGFSFGPYMTKIAKSVIDGTFKGETVRHGLAEGMLILAPFGVSVPQDVRTEVNAAADRIRKGYTPFTGPIVDNEGIVRIQAGETWDKSKMGDFDWYVKGVIGRAK